MQAVIFDLDGLLVDSEPLWYQAEIELFKTVGLHLTVEDCRETTGIRIDEVVALRFRQHPWTKVTQNELRDRIVARMVELMRMKAEPKPGALEAVDEVAKRGLKLAVASSSPHSLIWAALSRLNLERRFSIVHSAENEPRAKPYPDVYLTAARLLGVKPLHALAFEDSLPGVVAAKSAGMRCCAVPEHPNEAFLQADLVLESLEQLDSVKWSFLLAPPRPVIARAVTP